MSSNGRPYFYTCPNTVALRGRRTVWPVQMRLLPRHRLEEMPSLSSFQLPPGRVTTCAVSVGL